MNKKIKELENEYHVKNSAYKWPSISPRSLEVWSKVYDTLPKSRRLEGVEISPTDLVRYQEELNDFERQ